jgi:CheY-specific phosphatase CheX
MREISVQQAISKATADVLEKMFFTGFASETEGLDDGGVRISVRLAFNGERRGQLALGISVKSARTLTADFLGTDTANGPSDGEVNEVVLELANMICGYALSTLEKSALRLSAPEIVQAADCPLPERASYCGFDLGNGALTVGLVFEKDAHE